MKNVVFIGADTTEEYYINLDDKSLTGWSFMGLRANTEEELRESARNMELSDYFNVKGIPSQYLNEDQFKDDMEEEWQEHHDVQHIYFKDGEEYYCGFSSGTDIFNFFDKHKIKTYKDYKKVFCESAPLSAQSFKDLLNIMKIYKEDEKTGYEEFLHLTRQLSENPPYADKVKQ